MMSPRLLWTGMALFFSLQALILLFVIQQYRHPYAGPLWRRSWWWKGLMAVLMIVRRLYWLTYMADLDATEQLTAVALDIAISGTMAISLWYKSRIFDNSPPNIPAAAPALIVSDTHSIVLQWDSNAEALFGRTADEMLGRHFIPLLIPEHLQSAHRVAMARWVEMQEAQWGVTRTIRTDALHKDGSVFAVEISVVPVRGPAGEVQCHALVRRLLRL